MSTVSRSIRTTQPSELGFEYLKKGSPFKDLIKKHLSEDHYKKSLERKDVVCEVLLSKSEEALGYIVYKSQLEEQSFIVCDGKSIDSQRSDLELLSDRVFKLAKRSLASKIIANCDEESPWRSHLLEKKFQPSTRADQLLYSFGEPSKKRRLSSEESAPKKRAVEVEGRIQKRELPVPVRVAGVKGRGNPSPQVHNLPMKGVEYLNYIMNGKKKFEGRVCNWTCKKMKVGDQLKLFDRVARWGIICEITSLDTYSSFEAMLKAKGALSMLPQLEAKTRGYKETEIIQEGVKIYQAFPGANRVTREGAMAIGVKFLQKI